MKYNKKEQLENGWWIPVNPYDIKEYAYQPLTEANNCYSFKVYLCPSCSRVHESAWECGTGNQLHYYENFPTIGLKRIECTLCNNNG